MSTVVLLNDLKATHILHQLHVYLAPLLWFCIGFTACHAKQICTQKFDPIIDGISSTKIFKQPTKKTKTKLKSALDHELHPAYPLCLQNENKFNNRSRTPTVQARRALDFTYKCLSFNCHCTSNCSPNTYHKNCSDFFHKINQSYHHKSSTINVTPRISKQHKYSPKGIPTNKDIPNLNYTTKQYQHLHNKAHQEFVAGAKLGEDTMQLAQKIVTLTPSSFWAAADCDGYSKSFPVIWDTGASVCVSPGKCDFLSYQDSTDINEVKGLGRKRSKVAGQGIVSWSVHSVNGTL